jgi:hypothetical protein
MTEKAIVISTEDAIKIKMYIRETLKIVSIMADLVLDERIDEKIRQEYDQKLKGIDLNG